MNEAPSNPDPEQMREALLLIKDWSRAYSIDVFGAFSPQDLVTASQAIGEALFARLHAHWARHLLDGIGRIADEGLRGRGSE